MNERSMMYSELSEHLKLQIGMAATGCISGTLAEWPYLYRALELLGRTLPKDTLAIEVREVCKQILNEAPIRDPNLLR